MLTQLDDLLWHQLPTTFDHVGTSDPRFFDRYWFAIYAADGSIAAQFTMGAYRNMNVLDAGAVAVVQGKQFNVRASRSLETDMIPRCGPLEVEILQPLQEFRLTIEAGTHMRGEIFWRGTAPPQEERPHFKRIRGRIAEEYQRFDQIGEASGWLELAGERIALDHCWACRDHSWGVRPRIGIPEPVTGPKDTLEESGFTLAFLFFSTDTIDGHVLLSGRDGDEPYTTGVVRDLATGIERSPSSIGIDVDLHPGTRRFKSAILAVTVDTGEILRLTCEALGPAIAMQGLGYSGGFNDRKGLGVWRGASHVETDVWDVSEPARVRYSEASANEHWHRIQPVAVTCDANDGTSSRGTGSMTLILSGRISKLGLG